MRKAIQFFGVTDGSKALFTEMGLSTLLDARTDRRVERKNNLEVLGAVAPAIILARYGQKIGNILFEL